MCNQKLKHSMQGMGIIGTSTYNKPEYKDGLCMYHYKMKLLKELDWIDRPGYRAATIDDFNKQRTMKLSNSNRNLLFQYRNGKIFQYSNKNNRYLFTPMKPDITKFCVKDF